MSNVSRNRKIFFKEPVQVTCANWNIGGHSSQEPSLSTSGVIIPFSTGGGANSTATDTGGNSSGVILAAFADTSARITITNNTFSQAASTYQFYDSFIMPYTATLQNIYMVAVNSSNYTLGTNTVTPYVAIATAPSGSTNFTIDPNTITSTTPYTGTVSQGANYSGSKINLGIPISAGTRVAIVCGTNTSQASQTPTFNYNGALFFT